MYLLLKLGIPTRNSESECYLKSGTKKLFFKLKIKFLLIFLINETKSVNALDSLEINNGNIKVEDIILIFNV